MNYLFVCSANQKRSKTAEDHFAEINSVHEFRSAGTNLKTCRKLGTQEITSELIDWADIIYVMENKHRAELKAFDSNLKFFKIKVLNIPDRFEYMDSDLIHLLESKVQVK